MFSNNFKEIILEEISLEGLEGIGIDLLWKRISKKISSPVTEKLQCRFWNFIVKLDSISLYQNPVPVPHIEVLDRFTIIDESTGDLKEPDDYLDGPYEFNPIESDHGSCVHYKKRVLLIKDEVAKLSYQDIISEFGNTLVLVASIEERWAALAPHLSISYLSQLTSLHYCILELIGKSRENGQMTIGKTNLTKIVKDSKFLFYNRKVLQHLNLIRVTHITHVTAEKGGIKGILLRLRKFHKSFICTIPKTGLIHNLVQYLKEQPNYCEKTEVILKKGLLSQKQNKRFQKKFYIFGFEENPVDINNMSPTKKKPKPHTKRRYIYLCSHSDESSASEEEEEVPLRCQYKVGVNLLRQAYERFLEAGLNGLTQVELSQLLGIEFYAGRAICRLFKTKNIVREFLEDKGRQRMARFIAVAATAKIDLDYTNEVKKFLQHLGEYNNTDTVINPTESDPVPNKKRKIEVKDDNTDDVDGIIELKVIEGLPNVNSNSLFDSAKKMTVRQLKFGSGVLKVIRDLGYVAGYQTLGKIVAEETKDSPMDTKAIKSFLQKLVTDNYIKIFVIKWPGFKDKCTTLICAPHFKKTDPLMKAKYKEIVRMAVHNKIVAKNKVSMFRPLTKYAFPRFMKVQKLHEAIIKHAYFDHVKNEVSDLPRGFIFIKNLIPALTIEVALGNISSAGSLDIAKFTIDDKLLNVKICDAPSDLCRTLSNSTHLCNSLRSVLKTLALFGLVQLVAHDSCSNSTVPDNSLAIQWFYVNKHASLIDTSGIWPKLNTPIQNLEKKFTFNTFDDVQDYWSTVFNISTNTTIEVPNRKQKKPPNVPIRLVNDVEECDNGQRYGNQLGPCGFDSSFYLDIRRLWRAYSARTNKLQTNVSKKPCTKIPKFEKTKRKIKRVNKIKPKPKKVIQQIAEKLPTINQNILKKVMLKQTLVNRRETRKKPENAISWTQEEDRVVMVCRVAINILSPISQPGSLQVRNLVTKDILSLRDPKKTQKICHRRAAIVDYNSTLAYEKDCLLAELKRHHMNVIQKYEGTLKKLRILHSTNMSKYFHAARIPMLELVWIILQVLKNTSMKQKIPGSIIDEEFRKNFNVVPSSSNRPTNTYKTHPEDSIVGPLKEAIVLTVMLSFNNVVVKANAEKIYLNFDRYEERILRLAVDDLRKCGAIAAKEKILNGLMLKANLDDIVHCWYKISVQYQRKWAVRLNAEFADNLANCFGKPSTLNNLKGSSEINCFCCEMQTKGVLDITATTVPVITGSSGSIIQEEQLNSIDIETKYKLKSGTLGWKTKNNLEKFTDLYQDIDIEGPLDCLLRNSIINDNEHTEYSVSKIENMVVKHLTTKCEKGATFRELKETYGFEAKELIETLTKMEANNIIKRVGVFDNFIVLLKYCKHWSMVINNFNILTKPWLTVHIELRTDIFLKWVSVVMSKIFENPGCSLTYLSDSCEFLSTASIQDICDVLNKWKCVVLKTAVASETDLFSEDDDLITDLSDYNLYESPQNIIVFPVSDSLVKYAYIKNHILNKLSK